MGFEDREYSQENWDTTPRRETPATKWFVILAVVLFALQAMTMSATSAGPGLFGLMSLVPDDVLHGQIWRLVTFVLCNHPNDIIGIIFSLLITWRFGSDLERMYGTNEMTHYFVAMSLVVGAAFTALGFDLPRAQLYGSSTISLGLMALFATHFPRVEVYILPMISLQLRWVVAIYTMFIVYPSLLLLQQGSGLAGLTYATPALTIVLALVYRKYDWRLSAITENLNPAAWKRAWRMRSARQRLRVYQPTDDAASLRGKVDTILAKIHEHGSESLTQAERDLLARASEQYKNRM